MEAPLLTAKGVNGQVHLYTNKIVITREGFFGKMTFGFAQNNKDILLKSISAVQVKQPGLMLNGYIQFVFYGSQESKRGIRDATKDENSVVFNSRQTQDFLHFKNKVEEMMQRVDVTAPVQNNYNDLEKLADLKAKGIITEEEFSAKKKQILGL